MNIKIKSKQIIFFYDLTFIKIFFLLKYQIIRNIFVENRKRLMLPSVKLSFCDSSNNDEDFPSSDNSIKIIHTENKV